MYDCFGSGIREADLVEEQEQHEQVHFWEAILTAEQISPNELRHVRMAAKRERLGGEDTIVWPVPPVRPAQLQVAEMARVMVVPFRGPSRWC